MLSPRANRQSLAVLMLVVCASAHASAAVDGKAVYAQKCASCHGAAGEGTPKEFPRPLAGARSVGQLTKYIVKTMPADDPGTVNEEESAAISQYIFDAFYSKLAQARNKPPRVELSRLTVRQYRNVVTDLLGSFQGTAKLDDQHGLKGQYFKTKRRQGEPVLTRVDPQVRFDFKKESPDPKIEPKEFGIVWRGSIIPPESGEYEIIIRTENSFKLWVNDQRKPAIDATVKSGKDTEYKAPMYFLAGRPYSIRLEYQKGKSGVEDSKEKKAKLEIEPGSISLEWKPPMRPVEVIADRYLSPVNAPESFVLETAFPPDDRSVGYERGTTISKAWDQAKTNAAFEVADYVLAHMRDVTGVFDTEGDRKNKLKVFCMKFAERAFRRPLDDETKQRYVEHQFVDGRAPEESVKRVILLVLNSPRFLYSEFVNEKPDAYDVACRLSFGLWDSMPDQTLFDAAKAGKLSTREEISRQAERMVSDVRARVKMREFLHQWLKVETPPDISKDEKLYAAFDKQVLSDLRVSLDLFLDEVVWSESSDFRQLLLSDSLYLNGRLAAVYGAKLPKEASFTKVKVDSDVRAGVFSHPYLMSTFAYTATSSPIHRGVFVARSVLGRSLPAPPAAVAPLIADLHPNLTTRERVGLQTKPSFCASCHQMINPLGFSMENFDAIGRFRKDEKGKAIDASGVYDDPSGKSYNYKNARELATLVSKSSESHEAFVEQLFHYVVKQPIRAYGLSESTSLRDSFVANGFNIRKLMVEIVSSTALSPQNKPATVVHATPAHSQSASQPKGN